MKTTNKGFTLLELMVVVGIIGILTSVLYANFSDARQDARSRSFQAAMKETQLAIELYKAQTGQYPDVAIGCNVSMLPMIRRTAQTSSCGSNSIIDKLVPDFIADLPDPAVSANDNCDLVYSVGADFSWYKLTAVNCHAGTAMQADDELARCPNIAPCSLQTNCSGTSFDYSYAVYSAGEECS